MDGVIDSGSLNGDISSSPDNAEHAIQNQQDAEARRLKRGHVLSELLETERIYVNEMSSILKLLEVLYDEDNDDDDDYNDDDAQAPQRLNAHACN
ncbi:hypothetical protein ACLKA7_012234 [Drosophila subpalustris]